MPTTTPRAETLSGTTKPLLEWKDLGFGLTFYILSSTVVLLSALFGHEFIEGRKEAQEIDYISALTRWDSGYYRDIAMRGYWWDANKPSGVAFFPVYPLIIRGVWEVTHERVELLQVWIAQVLLAISFVLLHAYARLRLGDSNRTTSTVLAFAIFPTTVFFRLGYSESTFVTIVLLYLLSTERRWPLAVSAIICGVATATRPPGIALLPALLFEVYRRSAESRILSWRILGYGILGSWGLIGYMAHQWLKFGEPFAFAQTQHHWTVISGSFGNAVLSELSLEPLWSTYRPESARYWGHHKWGHHKEFTFWWAFNLYFANPILFFLTAMLVIWGLWKRVLKPGEGIVGIGLLLIPYITKSYAQSMHSFGRFAAVVLPVYLVIGYLLSKLPSGLAGMIVVFLAFWLIIYSIFSGAGELFEIT